MVQFNRCHFNFVIYHAITGLTGMAQQNTIIMNDTISLTDHPSIQFFGSLTSHKEEYY